MKVIVKQRQGAVVVLQDVADERLVCGLFFQEQLGGFDPGLVDLAPADVLGRWTFDPYVLAPLLALHLLYGRGLVALRGRHGPLARRLSHQEMQELTLTVGYYMMVCRFLETFDVDIEDAPVGLNKVPGAAAPNG